MLKRNFRFMKHAFIGYSHGSIQSQKSLLIPPFTTCVNNPVLTLQAKYLLKALVNMYRLAGVLRRTFGIVREHVGTDHLGNKYYVIPEQKTWTGKF